VYFSIYLCICYVLKSKFKIDVVIMIIGSILIIINSVLTLQVSTAKPMIADRVKYKVAFNHTLTRFIPRVSPVA
jgi:hypothetical protein